MKRPDWYSMALDHATAMDEIFLLYQRSPKTVTRKELRLIESMVDPDRKAPYTSKEIMALLTSWTTHWPETPYPTRKKVE